MIFETCVFKLSSGVTLKCMFKKNQSDASGDQRLKIL